MTHGKALPPEMVEQIVAKTDGVPLFVEELTKMVLESGLLQELEDRYALTGPLPPLAIPTTLHDSLMARLDRLAAVKALAQLGATLGREFSYALLRAAETRTPEAWFLALLAEVYGHCDQADTGLRVLAESQTIAHNTGEHFYEAERCRIEGELLLTQSLQTFAKATACFGSRKALTQPTCARPGPCWKSSGHQFQPSAPRSAADAFPGKLPWSPSGRRYA